MEEKNKPNRIRVLAFITAMIPLFSLAFSAFEYVRMEIAYNKQKSFENYHFLISNFGKGGTSSEVAAATIYELKNYPQYCEVTLSILNGFESSWTDELSLKTIHLVKPELESACK